MEEEQETGFAHWLKSENDKSYAKSRQKYLENYNWTEEHVIKPRLEPSVEQIRENSQWVNSRWAADLLRDQEYKPSVNFLKALIARKVDSMSTRVEIISSEDYIKDMDDILQAGPDAWREYSNLSSTDLRERYSPTWSNTTLYPNSAGYPTEQHEIVESKYVNILNSTPGSDPEAKIVDRSEQHPNFPNGLVSFDDVDGQMIILDKLSERLEGTKELAEVSEWMMDNFAKINEYSDFDEHKSFMYLMVDNVGPLNEANDGFYTKFARYLASRESFESEEGSYGDLDYYSGPQYELTTPSGEKVKLDEYAYWDNMRVTFGFSDKRKDTVDALAMIAARPENADIKIKVMSTMFGEKGLAGAFNYYREVFTDENISPEERANVKAMMESIWEGVVPKKEGQTVLESVEAFYNVVGAEHHPMTEETEGDRRVESLDEILTKEGITPEDLVVDLACGNGWLKKRLEDLGYNTIGIDMNSKLINEAKEKYGEDGYYVATWNNFRDKIPNHEKPKVVIINGRSIHHAEGFPGLHEIMMELDGVDTIIFDALDPTTGGRAESLDKFRQVLENFDFDKKWLDKYMWLGVGSIDGTILSDRWYPPQEWFHAMAGLYGYKYEKIVEENYDGTGTDNMLQVLRRVKDETEREALIERAEAFFREEMSDQPRNPNGYSLDNWIKPRRRASEFN